jgi:hypothetical protein
MMLLALRICLVFLGASAVAIASSILAFGAQATAGAAEQVFAILFRWSGPLSGPWSPTMDSELRFYAALWGAYGLLVLAVARDLSARRRYLPWLAAVFFAGGVGRVASYVGVGPPHPFFTLLMIIELLLPVGVVALWLGAERSAPPQPTGASAGAS